MPSQTWRDDTERIKIYTAEDREGSDSKSRGTIQRHDVIKLHLLEEPSIVTSAKHTCVMIMLFNQYLRTRI